MWHTNNSSTFVREITCQISMSVAVAYCYLTASLTVAAPFVVWEYEARLACALEAAGGVGAGAKLAYVGLHLTLIDIWEGKIGGVFVCVCVRADGSIPLEYLCSI